MTSETPDMEVSEEYMTQRGWNHPSTPPRSFGKITKESILDLKVIPLHVLVLHLIPEIFTENALPLMFL
jgi:hypothetical protein